MKLTSLQPAVTVEKEKKVCPICVFGNMHIKTITKLYFFQNPTNDKIIVNKKKKLQYALRSEFSSACGYGCQPKGTKKHAQGHHNF